MRLFHLLFPVFKQNVFKATTYAMLLAATCHLLTNLGIAMHTNDPDVINMFNVIGLAQIFPSLAHGTLNCLLGILFVIFIGVCFYALLQHHDIQQGRSVRRTSKK